MLYCSSCGHRVEYTVPPGDTRERHVCPQCGTIHYLNPKNVVGTVPIWQGSVLLCKRAIEPRKGYWTLPAGFMELGETTDEGAMRETIEEAGAHIELNNLFTLLNVAHVNQIHIFYLATLLDTEFSPGEESLEVKLFQEEDIPWKDLAFPTVRRTLEHYFSSRSKGCYNILAANISEKISP